MSIIKNNTENFAAEAVDGFCDIFRDHIVKVSGGLLRRHVEAKSRVSVVVGGGSGHFPAFAGFVGQGMADGAVVGDVFASPSASAITSVCTAAHQGKGVVLGYGNYAGDVLNFGAAAGRLRAAGVDVRIVAVTDDVASADTTQRHQRRGVAGDVAVFKIAGAAAAQGRSLDDVERLAKRANDNTVSLGIAFAGCTLPGAVAPLFTIPTGYLGLGLGIHGEPGISEEEIVSSSELARMLADRLLLEMPHGTRRVAAILNGLGGTKYEELFVLWNDVRQRLDAAGLTVVEPAVGEFVTSLDMRGCSLTLTWLDDELEQLWIAPCQSYVLSRGMRPDIALVERTIEQDGGATASYPTSTAASNVAGKCISDLFAALSAMLSAAETELGQLDARAGDGDHGAGMARGCGAAAKMAASAAAQGAGAASVLAAAGDAWADRAGGTSGAIWGVLLRSWSRSFSDDAAIDKIAVAAGARASLDAVMSLGGATAGDKTLVDALIPFVDTLEAGVRMGKNLPNAWRSAAEAAKSAAEATSALSPRRGRARPLAHLSVGHPDAGAISLAMCADVASRFINTTAPNGD